MDKTLSTERDGLCMLMLVSKPCIFCWYTRIAVHILSFKFIGPVFAYENARKKILINSIYVFRQQENLLDF
jgi:disulfide bond formation protein DsbB